MSFTDSDVARCKRLLAGEMSMKKIVLNNPEIEALLTRLDAAEALIAHSQEPRDDLKWFRLYAAWRKTKKAKT